jgi:hypothetical protein
MKRKPQYVAVYERSNPATGWSKELFFHKVKSKSQAAKVGEQLRRISTHPGMWSYYNYGTKKKMLEKYRHERTFGQINWF